MPTDITFNIFIAYSRKDSGYLDEIRSHFTPLERSGKVTIWYDGKIEPGAVWETEIKERLHAADIILLLVSASAIASDYFYDKEMKDALERHSLGTTKVVPFILRPCTWKATPLAKLQVIPKDGKAATTWNDRDEAYSDAVNSLWEMVINMEQRSLIVDKAEEEERLKAEEETKKKQEEQQRIREQAEAKKHQEEQQRSKEEAEEESKLKEKAATKRQQEERRVKEQTATIKNIDPSGKGSDKNTKEASLPISNYRIPLIIAGVIAAILFFVWIANSGNNPGTSDMAEPASLENSTVNAEIQAWNDATTNNTIESYKAYQQVYGHNGLHFGEAQKSIDKIIEKNDWDTALSLGTIEAYQKYLDVHPTGSHVGEANQKITAINKQLADEQLRQQREEDNAKNAAKIAEDKAWNVAKSSNTIASYQGYQRNYPKGNYFQQAQQNIELLNPIGIGKKYQGGIIFYIDNTGKHGLIAAEKDLGVYNWGEAMNQCKNLRLNGYDDWRLPTYAELDKLYLKKDKVGGFASPFYWSSSEDGFNYAWTQSFPNGHQNIGGKDLACRVRAVRAF